ncbi:MAG: polysaccharide pyruvyl transferase family protein [Bacteroidia bacterium]|nr:polysaccharide pyruvyl transferase family protein [Bacteroidia bacterium]
MKDWLFLICKLKEKPIWGTESFSNIKNVLGLNKDNSTMISGEDLINSLSLKIDKVLEPLIPKGISCALIEFPNYANSGDSAIWLGEKKWLHKNKNEVVYTCDMETYSQDMLVQQLGKGIILLQGGGNFGDLWKRHQHFREQIIHDFPNNKIIQLPQTIFFKQKANLEQSQKILNSHSNLTLLCRDTLSFDFAQKEFTTQNILCPDMAFVLGKIQRPCPSQIEIVWLSRTDKETLNKSTPKEVPGVQRIDWLEETYTDLHEHNKRLSKEIKIHSEKNAAIYTSLIRTYDPLARQRFLRGCKILSRGKVVVTDRLHAHILCLLMDIPHILLDNSYGKIKGFYETWTKNNELTVWANSAEEVINCVLFDSQFRLVLDKKGINLTSIDDVINRLKISINLKRGWTTPEEDKKELWLAQVTLVNQDILEHLPQKQNFILVDENLIRNELNLPYHTVIPFLEHKQQYIGPPPEDNIAIKELERLRLSDTSFLVIAWPSFWWFEYYKAWHQHLRSKYHCILENERLVIFDLRKLRFD